MDKVEFVPVFDVHVTGQDLIDYYTEHSLEYPKLKNGYPNMSRRMNKDTFDTIVASKQKALCLQYQDLIKQKTQEKKKEACMFRVTTARSDPCPICFEEIVGMAILECTHVFCINCTINHFRLKNTCPLCRAEVCDKPVIKENIPTETIHAIAIEQSDSQYPNRHNLPLYNYLLESTINLRALPNIEMNTHNFVNMIFDEVINSSIDMGIRVREWYDA